MQEKAQGIAQYSASAYPSLKPARHARSRTEEVRAAPLREDLPPPDHGRPHTAVTWGGTAFNWLENRLDYITPERTDTFWLQKYTALAMRFADIAAKVHADGLLSNHTIFDGSKTKLPLVRARSAEQVNPYVVGGASVQAYLTLAAECAKAGLGRVTRR